MSDLMRQPDETGEADELRESGDPMTYRQAWSLLRQKGEEVEAVAGTATDEIEALLCVLGFDARWPALQAFREAALDVRVLLATMGADNVLFDSIADQPVQPVRLSLPPSSATPSATTQTPLAARYAQWQHWMERLPHLDTQECGESEGEEA